MDMPEAVGGKRVRFALHANPACRVSVAGTFNDWNPKANGMRYRVRERAFVTTLTLAPGRYEYKFIVDGSWCVDPEQPEWIPNGMGTLNSVRRVE
jgi:1,4-alpha-glucan branching enzyme